MQKEVFRTNIFLPQASPKSHSKGQRQENKHHCLFTVKFSKQTLSFPSHTQKGEMIGQ